MIQIQHHNMWQYLEDRWEIKYITAEACGVGLRVRIDIGPAGERLLSEMFGGMTLTHPGWNERAWKTMMFPRDLLEPLIVWALLHESDIVIRTAGAFYLALSDDEFNSEETQRFIAQHKENDRELRHWRKRGTAMNGLQNRHVFSGRVL